MNGSTLESSTRQRLERPATAWLFDIDGVLTEPEQKVIRKKEILVELTRRLERGDPIGGNTGRSLRFAEERFLDPLVEILGNAALLANVAVIGDKGGTWLVHDGDGGRLRFVDESLETETLRGLLEDARRLVYAEYVDLAFVDETKQTMVTIEMKDGVRINDFQAIQGELVGKLRRAVEARGLASRFRVDATRIAIDIEDVRAGKALGARRFVQFLRGRGINPQHYVAFGDSPSDYDMAEELHRLGLSVEFVFVGGKDYLHERDRGSFPVVYTRGRCDDGTLEYLAQREN